MRVSVTIKDVAKKAGVSPSTVSRVLSKHPRISPATSEKVRKVIEELGYHPNLMAKSLVSNSTQTLALILPRPAEELFLNLFFSEFIRGMVAHATQESYDLIMVSGSSELEEVEAVKRLVKGHLADGVVLLSTRHNDPIISFLSKENFPFILIGRSDEFPDILSIDTDNVQAAFDVTSSLIALGHSKIGFINGPSHLVVSKDRLKGYKKALHDSQLSFQPEWIYEGAFTQETGFKAISSILSSDNRPTALVVVDDLVTYGVLNRLHDLGYNSPKDISIISFNNVPISELTNPPISSVDIGIYQMGFTASQTLIKRVLKQEIEHNRIIIPHRIIKRESIDYLQIT